jgi:hypothetical membrane protein
MAANDRLTATDNLAQDVCMSSTSSTAGAYLLRDTSRNIAAAIALLVAVVMFSVAETVSAAAWHTPAYSYANDFVSDLGVPGTLVMFKGHPIYSPLAWLLNAGFVVDGLLVAVAAVLLLRPAGQGRMAAWQRRLLIGFGIGLPMAGFLHESPAWSLPFHAIGATLAMAGGNIAILLTGLLAARLGVPGWLARVFMVLGAVGLAFFLAVQVLVFKDSAVLPHGIGALERGAAYPVLATQLIVGVALLVESARLRNRSSQVTGRAATIAA